MCAALVLLLAACAKEELPGQGTPELPSQDRGTVSLRFRLPGRIASGRSEGEQIRDEEGTVKSLCYAIFRKNMYETGGCIEFADSDPNVQPGGEYQVANLDKELFDETTRIYAIANLREEERKKLLDDPAPTLEENLNHPLLLQSVGGYIELCAQTAVYDAVIEEQLTGDNKYPKDGKIHFKPASNGHISSKQYDLEEVGIEPFDDYEELLKLRDKETDADKQAIYDIITEDLQCRLPLYHLNRYNSVKTSFQAEEISGKVYSKKLAKDGHFTRFVQWYEYQWEENLNKVTAAVGSRTVENPLMAGYLALTDMPGSAITVPMEHVYCRLWFRFSFVGQKNGIEIHVDKIEVTGLPQKTRMFNQSRIPAENNIEGAFDDEDATACIRREEEGQSPFFGRLAQKPAHREDEQGNIIRLCFTPEKPEYNAVCRYPLRGGADEFDTGGTPLRYYLYAYQWGGTSLEDDPTVRIEYHFTPKLDEGEGQVPGPVYKAATARLYDENHAEGKRHHGLLRNYTYEVDCEVNMALYTLGVQIVPHSWYSVPVDDIPSFD